MNHSPQSRTSILGQWHTLVRWLLISACLSFLIGSSVALFLWILDLVTQLHWRFELLLFMLPLAGAASGLMYHYLGPECGESNGWLYDRIRRLSDTNNQDPESQRCDDNGSLNVPLVMAPLVMLCTFLTHLCGGSAGREGTAVQMGGSIAGGMAGWMGLNRKESASLLQVGVAAGFSAVFGTPLAATLFAVEVVGRGASRISNLLPCLFSAILADKVVTGWGIEHTAYHIQLHWLETIEFLIILKLAALGIAIGSAAWLFLQSAHWISFLSQRLIPAKWMRPVIGGVVLVAIVYCSGSRQYLGLGVVANPSHADSVCIVSSFSSGGAEPLSWLWKTLLTALTVGTGFKGGEATPLFFVGSTLGNSLGGVLSLPIDFAAGLGFVAVFASATRTPLAGTMMALEIFSSQTDPLQKVLLAVCALLTCQIATQLRFRLAKERSHS